MAADKPEDIRATILSSGLRLPDRKPASPLHAGEEEGPEPDPEIPPLPASLMAPRLVGPELERRRPSLGRVIAVGAGALLAGGLAAGVWLTYQRMAEDRGQAEVPLIMADKEPEKVPPQQEGGLEVPFQDETIYDQVTPGASEPAGEQLLPPSETPQAPPAETAEVPPPDVAPSVEELALPAPPPPIQFEPAPPEPADAAEAAPAESEPAAPAAEETAALPEAEAPVSDLPIPPVKPPLAGAAAPAAAVAAAPESVPAPAVEGTAAAGGAIRIQLASLKSEEAASAEWRRLQRRFPDLLGGLEATLLRAQLSDQSVFYRLQAGPVASRAAAEELCTRLREQKQQCLVAR